MRLLTVSVFVTLLLTSVRPAGADWPAPASRTTAGVEIGRDFHARGYSKLLLDQNGRAAGTVGGMWMYRQTGVSVMFDDAWTIRLEGEVAVARYTPCNEHVVVLFEQSPKGRDLGEVARWTVGRHSIVRRWDGNALRARVDAGNQWHEPRGLRARYHSGQVAPEHRPEGERDNAYWNWREQWIEQGGGHHRFFAFDAYTAVPNVCSNAVNASMERPEPAAMPAPRPNPMPGLLAAMRSPPVVTLETRGGKPRKSVAWVPRSEAREELEVFVQMVSGGFRDVAEKVEVTTGRARGASAEVSLRVMRAVGGPSAPRQPAGGGRIAIVEDATSQVRVQRPSSGGDPYAQELSAVAFPARPLVALGVGAKWTVAWGDPVKGPVVRMGCWLNQWLGETAEVCCDGEYRDVSGTRHLVWGRWQLDPNHLSPAYGHLSIDGGPFHKPGGPHALDFLTKRSAGP